MLDLCRCHLLNVNDDGGEHGLPVAVNATENVFVEFDDALGFFLAHGIITSKLPTLPRSVRPFCEYRQIPSISW